jgi:GTP-binding protein Era
MASGFRVGYVTLAGRPNVGKSTLLNRLVGMKVSIVSRRPQTTRHRILGILTEPDAQLVFVDTPGFQTRHGSALNRLMNRTLRQSLQDVDVVVLVIEASGIRPEDKRILGLIPPGLPVVLAVNKIDLLKDRKLLLPLIEQASQLRSFAAIVPISAERGSQIGELAETLKPLLPEGEPAFDADAVTDRSERFLAAELVREKLFEALGEELPYSTTVTVDSFVEERGLRRIQASILVDKESQKAIVIGAGGAKLKTIGTRARRDMQALFGGKVHLELWVRVKRGWADDMRALKSLGYE